MTTRQTRLLIAIVLLIVAAALIARNLLAPSSPTGPSEHEVSKGIQPDRSPGGAQDLP